MGEGAAGPPPPQRLVPVIHGDPAPAPNKLAWLLTHAAGPPPRMPLPPESTCPPAVLQQPAGPPLLLHTPAPLPESELRPRVPLPGPPCWPRPVLLPPPSPLPLPPPSPPPRLPPQLACPDRLLCSCTLAAAPLPALPLVPTLKLLLGGDGLAPEAAPFGPTLCGAEGRLLGSPHALVGLLLLALLMLLPGLLLGPLLTLTGLLLLALLTRLLALFALLRALAALLMSAPCTIWSNASTCAAWRMRHVCTLRAQSPDAHA